MLVPLGIGPGAVVSLFYDGPLEVGFGPAVAFLAIALDELYHRRR